MLTAIFIVFAVVIALQLLYPFGTVVAAQLLGKERLRPEAPEAGQLEYACIITAYKNAEIARPLMESLLQQRYPNLTIYLVADECPETAFETNNPRFMLLRPEVPLRLKAKSIRYAMDRLRGKPDYVVIFDADNLAHPDFLMELNPYTASGYPCVQGQRTAKNLDTTYAALDSMGEHYKNYIERYVPWLLGGSAVISGSGMAVRTDLYRAYLESPAIENGQHLGKKMLQEDKILQHFLLCRNETIAYARKALVYDEKVSSGAAVETQRSRWLFSYFQNLPNALGLLGRGIVHASWNQLYFGAVTIVLPMFIQLALAGILFLAGLLLAPWCSVLLFLSGIVFIANIFWCLQLDHAPTAVRAAAWKAPLFVFRQVLSLFKMFNPAKNFQHTEHQKAVRVEEVMKKE